LDSRREADSILAETINNKSLRNFLLKNLHRNKHGLFNWRINLNTICSNLDSLGSEITSSGKFEDHTLFIKGEKSDYIIESDQKDINTFFPNSRIVAMPGTTHWLHAEKPELFFKTVYSFLKD